MAVAVGALTMAELAAGPHATTDPEERRPPAGQAAAGRGDLRSAPVRRRCCPCLRPNHLPSWRTGVRPAKPEPSTCLSPPPPFPPAFRFTRATVRTCRRLTASSRLSFCGSPCRRCGRLGLKSTAGILGHPMTRHRSTSAAPAPYPPRGRAREAEMSPQLRVTLAHDGGGPRLASGGRRRPYQGRPGAHLRRPPRSSTAPASWTPTGPMPSTSPSPSPVPLNAKVVVRDAQARVDPLAGEPDVSIYSLYARRA
jgi:hypothetical protein